MITEQEWREIWQSPGGISTCRDTRWLLNGCPRCGCKEWQVTDDGWAYCDGCAVGIPTWGPLVGRGLWHFGPDGWREL